MRLRHATLSVLITLAGGLLVAMPAQGTSIYWANPVDGSWSDSTKWLPEQVPGPGDAAFIIGSGTYTVTVDTDIQVDRVGVGAASGTQTLLNDGHQVALDSGVSAIHHGAELRLAPGSTLWGAGSLSNDADVFMDSSSINIAISNLGLLEASDVCTIEGSVTTGTSSTIRVTDGSSLTISAGFTNNNLISLIGDGAILSLGAGTLTNASDAFILASGLGSPRTLEAELNNLGTVNINADLSLTFDSASHTNSGDIYCTRNLTVIQTGATPSFSNTGTIRINAGYAMTVTGGTLDNASSGSILGDGTLDVSTAIFTNAGEVAPGLSAGTLTVTGDYNQTADGVLTIELGGITQGTEYDLLAVSDSARLDGTLDINLINGFFPIGGDSFQIITYAGRSGVFSDTSSLVLGSGINLVQQYRDTYLTLLAVSEPDIVVPIAPEVCITPHDTCMTIPFKFFRTDTSDVRGYSVTFSLTSELQFCDGMNSIVEGPYLQNYCGGGCTYFFKNDNGDGSYTVDCTIAGADCGPDTSGTLFFVDLTHTGSDGTGTVTIDTCTVRDCANQPVPAIPGNPISIGIDVAYPADITDLAAGQVKSDNDSDGTTQITVTFSGAEAGHLIEVFRKGYGHYPEYDDSGGAVPTPPATPEAAIAEGWTLTAVTETGQTDDPPERDYWYYILFETSDCDLQVVSNMTDGTLNYHLGDVSDGLTLCQGDNLVGLPDMGFLGTYYFLPVADSVNCLDVGPTDDYSVDGLPTTDNMINFEDLIMFAINFGLVSMTGESPVAEIGQTSPEYPQLVVSVEAEELGSNSVLTVRLLLEGNESVVKGIHSLVSYDAHQMELLDVSPGSLIENQAGSVFFKHMDSEEGVWFDAVALGQNRTLSGSGDVAVYRFQTRSAASLPSLELADLRDAQNRFLLDAKGGGTRSASAVEPGELLTSPAETRLLGARPNPFSGSTHILFHLASETQVSLRVYDVSGRLIRTMVDRALPAGEYSLAWNGKSDSGHDLVSGIYFYSFQAGKVQQNQKLFLYR